MAESSTNFDWLAVDPGTGTGNADVGVTADANEGKDRTLTLAFSTADANATASAVVSQTGKREEFVASDNNVFSGTDGEFLVLK